MPNQYWEGQNEIHNKDPLSVPVNASRSAFIFDDIWLYVNLFQRFLIPHDAIQNLILNSYRSIHEETKIIDLSDLTVFKQWGFTFLLLDSRVFVCERGVFTSNWFFIIYFSS